MLLFPKATFVSSIFTVEPIYNVLAFISFTEVNEFTFKFPDISSPDKVKSLLKIRYNYLKGDIKNHITELL